ncbi:uncharacterized protein LOC110759001 isoform X2 [Prunus avium]|uniref:Uncharacterized protein LOC110759001 isoform X2 n=1 Tax=Prunus avium TaxID=42229 RepID=A0A6P5SR12_PRUAV|nr:uncharacterized protein LOC110759001 isoform X2 [Prunus avium]
MASTSSPALSVSKLDFQFLSSQRNITFSKENLHQVKMPRRMSKFSGFESNGFILFSSLSGQIGEGSFPSPEATANNNAPEVQVQSSDHWRKNIPVLAKSHRVYSIDLIGYGYSDKPNPRQFGESSFYTFETWGTQLNDFCIDVVKDEAFFICNSIGGLVGLQAAVMEPQLCKGVMLLNISLHMLHIKKQPWYGRPLIRSFQNLLRNTDVGKYFFKTVATPESVRNILCQCYHDTSQVTEELVQKILLPGLEPGAVDVFLEFICYSGGPLPEELLPQVKCPVLIGWGEKDPWEPIELGRAYGKFDSVQDFVVLPNVGHCPQDEAPDLVNPLVKSFVARHAALSASISTAT